MLKWTPLLLLATALFAQQPAAPDSVVIEYFPPGDSVRISWQPVTVDTAGEEICISLYKIYTNVIPWFETSLLRGITLDQYHSIIMYPPPGQQWYYWVTCTPGG